MKKYQHNIYYGQLLCKIIENLMASFYSRKDPEAHIFCFKILPELSNP